MRYQVIIATLIILLPVKVLADIVVIVNPNSGIADLTRHQIIDIYMGRSPGIKGQRFQPFDHPLNSVLRTEFYYKITGKPVSVINAYWARLLFTGRASPPRLVENNEAMLEIVREDPSAIGYLEQKYLNEHVTVVYVLENNE
jgi:ABC-type phosphate transport system substrate-binding protein